jgi:glycosyltransferase involved in cell wall biosynthesis
MVQVTVGVPVYNGGKYLHDCLECLRQQTFKDIEVLIHDNASTDNTGDIARYFCEIDTRFRYMHRPQNVGFVPNFMGLLEGSRCQYFCWRAHDDVSSLNWVEALVGAFHRNSTAILSISRVRTEHPDGTELQTFKAPVTQDRSTSDISREMLRTKCFEWFWCLWKRQHILNIMRYTTERYANPWGIDMAALFPVSVTGRATSSDDATFFRRMHPQSLSHTMMREADLAFEWSYQHAYKHHIWNAFSAIRPADLAPSIGRNDVKWHIRKMVGRRHFLKHFARRPRAALSALYSCYTKDFTLKPEGRHVPVHRALHLENPIA